MGSTSRISTSKQKPSSLHALNTKTEWERDLRLVLSTLALMVLSLRSNVTSRTPKRCQSRSKRNKSPRTLPRVTWKQRVLLAGLMCRKRDSQFICTSGALLRFTDSLESGLTPRFERMDDELELTKTIVSKGIWQEHNKRTVDLHRTLRLIFLLLAEEAEQTLPRAIITLSSSS